MTFGEIRWYGAWGSAMSVLFFLSLTVRGGDGWKLAIDLFMAAFWTWQFVRFLRLRCIVMEKPVDSITVNGEEIWP